MNKTFDDFTLLVSKFPLYLVIFMDKEGLSKHAEFRVTLCFNEPLKRMPYIKHRNPLIKKRKKRESLFVVQTDY